MSAFNDDDLDQSHVSSAEIDENTMTIPIVAEVGRDPEEEIKNLERHRRDLQVRFFTFYWPPCTTFKDSDFFNTG
jgi:hypothetical protein